MNLTKHRLDLTFIAGSVAEKVMKKFNSQSPLHQHRVVELVELYCEMREELDLGPYYSGEEALMACCDQFATHFTHICFDLESSVCQDVALLAQL